MVSPYVLRLASVDSLSQCIIWDIGQATPISEFSLGGKSLVDIQWLTTNVCFYITKLQIHYRSTNNESIPILRTHAET